MVHCIHQLVANVVYRLLGVGWQVYHGFIRAAGNKCLLQVWRNQNLASAHKTKTVLKYSVALESDDHSLWFVCLLPSWQNVLTEALMTEEWRTIIRPIVGNLIRGFTPGAAIVYEHMWQKSLLKTLWTVSKSSNLTLIWGVKLVQQPQTAVYKLIILPHLQRHEAVSHSPCWRIWRRGSCAVIGWRQCNGRHGDCRGRSECPLRGSGSRSAPTPPGRSSLEK